MGGTEQCAATPGKRRHDEQRDTRDNPAVGAGAPAVKPGILIATIVVATRWLKSDIKSLRTEVKQDHAALERRIDKIDSHLDKGRLALQAGRYGNRERLVT